MAWKMLHTLRDISFTFTYQTFTYQTIAISSKSKYLPQNQQPNTEFQRKSIYIYEVNQAARNYLISYSTKAFVIALGKETIEVLSENRSVYIY